MFLLLLFVCFFPFCLPEVKTTVINLSWRIKKLLRAVGLLSFLAFLRFRASLIEIGIACPSRWHICDKKNGLDAYSWLAGLMALRLLCDKCLCCAIWRYLCRKFIAWRTTDSSSLGLSAQFNGGIELGTVDCQQPRGQLRFQIHTLPESVTVTGLPARSVYYAILYIVAGSTRKEVSQEFWWCAALRFFFISKKLSWEVP